MKFKSLTLFVYSISSMLISRKISMFQDANKTKLKELEEKIEDAEKNQGETEIRDAMLAKAEHLCRVGDKEEALTAFRFGALRL